MPLAKITYQTIVNQVKNWIKANCKNINNYGSISAQFKPDWGKTETVLSGSGYTGTSNISIINDTAINSVSASIVDTDMTNFLNTLGLKDKLNNTITEPDFYHFIQDMISFMCTKCAFATSQYAQSERHLIYKNSNTTFNTTYTMSFINGADIINAKDVTDIMKTMIDVVHQTIRCHHCRYTLSISGLD